MAQFTLKAVPGRSHVDPDWSSLRNRLWQAALALTRSREDAEDLTQQTLASVLTRRPELVTHVGYVRSTMLRLWLDEQRSLRRRTRRLARLALTVAASAWERDRTADHESHEHIQQAIDTLSPQQHAAIVLRVVEGLDYEEIAAALDCPIGTVRANLHLARKRMRHVLGEPT